MTIDEVSTMKRYPASEIRVLVIGAGLGGLFVAIELYRKGHDVEVVEAREAIDELGDFVGLSASATRQFEKWPGMSQIYSDLCYKPQFYMYTMDGVLLGGPFEAIKDGTSHIPRTIPRPKLVRALYEYAVSLGIQVRFNTPILDFYESVETQKAGAITDRAERLEADLVVAADGVGTKSWRIVTGGEKLQPRSSGFSVYRVAYDVKLAYQDPVVRKKLALPENGDDLNTMYLGPDTHAAIMMSADVCTWLLTHRESGTAAESWSRRLDPEDVYATEKERGWCDELMAVIRRTPKQSIVDWKLMWRDPHPQWTSPAGLVVQLGDSAHSFLPTSANGATQALEDGISLASCLELGGKNNIPLATRVHNTLRFPRVACAQKSGFKNREMYHHTNFEEAKRAPEKLSKMVGRWLFSHDPEAYVYKNWRACVNHLIAGASFQNTNIPPGYVYKPWSIDELLKASDESRTVEDEGDWS